jgi:hypothetical protein
MHRDAEVVAGFLRVEEAEMLTELLSSAGIEAWFEGAIGTALGGLIPGAGGGAKLLVRGADAPRARELIAASGIFRAEPTAGADPATQAAEAGAAPGAEAGDRGLRKGRFPLYPLLVVAAVVAATAAMLLARP